MAELAAGLSRSVVVGAITKVQAAVEDAGARLRQNAKDDLVFIAMELEMMQSFLDEGSAKKNLRMMTWVKHTREVTYDVEDCIENVVHPNDKEPISWQRRLLPSCLTATLLPDQDLEKLKVRLQEFNNYYRRSNNNNNNNNNNDDDDDDNNNSAMNLVDDSAAAPAAAAGEPTQAADTTLQQEQQLAPTPGADMLVVAAATRDASRWLQGSGNLTQLITSYHGEPALQVISIWGTGGHHGMTSIVCEAYNDDKICQSFTHRAWVKLTHPFTPTDFIKKLVQEFYASAASQEQQTDSLTTTVGIHVLEKMNSVGQQLYKEFERLVTEKKWLIVLEGLSNMAEWNAIKTFLPDKGKGSRIVVSTHSFEMASLCVGNSYKILEIKKFSVDHSVYAVFDEGQMMYVETQTSSDHKNVSNRRAAEKWMKNALLGVHEPEMNELREYLAKPYDNRPSVFSSWGISGVGKSTLVKNIYYDEVLLGKNFDKYYWLDVSHPLNLRDFYQSLLLDFHSEEDRVEKCNRLLEHDRCLIVIDELRSKEEWDMIQPALVCKKPKSVIIVITIEASIARYCTSNEDLVYNVKALEATASLDLFKMKVNKKNKLSLLEDKKDEELEELILKCGGLPKVIVSTSELLAKQTGKLMDNIGSFSRRFMHHLETSPEFRSSEGQFGCINSIVLNPPAFLKPCIFYLSIFPQGQIIRRRRLVRRWIAEGYSRESIGRHAEENGEKLYSELLELSIFQQVPQLIDARALSDTKMVFYQVNAFIREYILSQRMKENLVFELGGSCALTTQNMGRHLIILKNWDRDRTVFNNHDFSRLRSLTVFGKWEPFFISETMKLICVVDLEDASGVTDDDLENMVKLLQRLKFLSLRGCREICRLPDSLGDLRQLQTLDVMDTSIVNLPKSITKLQKLHYVRASTIIPIAVDQSTATVSASWLPKFRRKRNQLVGVEVPAGIEKLTMLHTLGVINIAASGGKAIMKELKELTQLRKLGVSGINKHNSKEFFSLISGQGHLESLSVRLDKGYQVCLDDISLPWEKLHSLKLYGLGDKLPLSSNNLAKLRKLDLEMNSLMQSDIKFLAELPNLCILGLGVRQPSLHFYAESDGNQLKSFEKVKILEIACSNNSLHVTFGSKAMKNLEVLNLDCSSGSSSYLLSGLNYQSELKEVLLKGTNDEALKIALQSQLLKHPKKPVVKLMEQTRSS